MHVERATEDIYIFTSERYAQVTASLIVSGNMGVLIDTMPFPEETAQIALLAHKRCPDGVRYIIYTQHEADHIYGAYLFPKAEIIAHERAREFMIQGAYRSLEQAKASSKEFEHVTIRLPTFSFSHGSFTLRLPGKTLEIFATPGHTPDSVAVLLHEERLLFAGDTVMAIPTISNGDPAQLKESLTKIATMQLESIVQGHGEMILRGEIKEMMRRSINYLDNVQNRVQKIVEAGGTREEARAITIESCGLQRVLLNGVVAPLHTANVLALYDKMTAGKPAVAAASAPPPKAAPTKKAPTSTSKTKAVKPKPARRGAPSKPKPAPKAAAKSKPPAKTAKKPKPKAAQKAATQAKPKRKKGR
jgi:glyoxylase-like metal-dependent hydrolase (beta-lactamase superfamily II)